MLTIAECIVRAAIERRESRGAHWRLDYLKPDAALGRINFIAYSDGGNVRLRQREVPAMPAELAKLFDGEASTATAVQPPTPEAKRVPA
jgi:succinate dehydrogenase / fumarate reductase flavoprotein subunit